MARLIAVVAVLCFIGSSLAAGASAADAKIPREGYKAPDFTLNGLDGQEVTLSKLLDKSSVVLVVLRGYPGYQCPICTLQVGGLLRSAKQLADTKAQVVLVYPGPAEDLDQRATEFMKGKKLPENFSLVIDLDYQFTNAYGLRWDAPRETAYPSTFVIDREGTIRLAKVSEGHAGRAKIDEIIKALPGTK
jgi:peroxiredoxin Q/BCP